MDLVLAGGESQLLESLDFSLKPQANYVQARFSNTAYPSGASAFSYYGVRTSRFTLTASEGGWIDCSTLRLCGTVVNLDSHYLLWPFSPGLHSFIYEMRILVAGVEVERLAYYNRTHEMLFNLLQDPGWNQNEGVEGCKTSSVIPYDNTSAVIEVGDRLTMMMKPGFGLILNGGKYLPVKHAPITIEITLANPTDAVHSSLNTVHAPGLPPFDPPASQSYEIQNFKILYDSVMLDSALENSYTAMLLANKSLTIGYSTWHTTYNSINLGSQTLALSIVRACTRLKGIYVTFHTPNANFTSFAHPSGQQWQPGLVASDLYYALRDPQLTCQIQVGAKTFPVQPISSTAEFFEQLRKIAGCHNQDFRSLSITRSKYESGAFIIGMSMERVPGANAHSGYNTRSGDLVRIQLTGMAAVTDTGACDSAYITLWSDQILMISEQGATVLD